MSSKRKQSGGAVGSSMSTSSKASKELSSHRPMSTQCKRIKTKEEDFICPVMSKGLNYSNGEIPATISLSPSLEDLLGGYDSNDFLQHVFRKSALHVHCEDSLQKDKHERIRVGYLVKEMFDLNRKRILEETSSDNIFLWLRPEERKKNELIHSIEVGDPQTAFALHDIAGHATYCRAPPKVEQKLVASLLRATGMGCGQYDPSGESAVTLGRGEVETFISTSDHVTDWHYDFQENFTIQLSGRKKWTLMHGTIKDPLRGCTPHYNSPEAVESQLKAAYLFDRKFVFGKPNPPATARGEERSIIMAPGDVLYFPAGIWHRVETIEPGVSINVSLMATNYANLISSAIYQYLYRDSRSRQPIVNNSICSAVDHLKSILQDLPVFLDQFVKREGCGALDILPPVLQYPPSFQAEEEEEDALSIDENEGDSIVERPEIVFEGEENIGGNRDDNGASHEQGGNNTINEKGTEDAVDPASFVDYPEEWNFSLEIGSQIEILKNPLSALHNLDEINAFYQSRANESKAKRDIFVLNVNFANGNCESAVRVVFYDNEEGMAKRFWELERLKNGAEDEYLDIVNVTDRNHYLVSFLVYHGYMQVKAKTL